MSLDLRAVTHRPYPPPARPWVMAQTWQDLLFAHWPVEEEALRRLVPAGLELDRFEGRTWVGVVPFRMSNIRARGLPAFPVVSAFPELNVRTYVTRGGRPGVWFFSLDAASVVAVEAARALFHLPYLAASMECRRVRGEVRYESRRVDARGRRAEFRARYSARGPEFRAEAGTLEHWLTERYCLFARDGRGRFWRGEIHHEPWPLRPATAEISVNTMAAAAGIDLRGDAHLLMADRIETAIWPLARAV